MIVLQGWLARPDLGSEEGMMSLNSLARSWNSSACFLLWGLEFSVWRVKCQWQCCCCFLSTGAQQRRKWWQQQRTQTTQADQGTSRTAPKRLWEQNHVERRQRQRRKQQELPRSFLFLILVFKKAARDQSERWSEGPAQGCIQGAETHPEGVKDGGHVP